jgi:hypothetical protein
MKKQKRGKPTEPIVPNLTVATSYPHNQLALPLPACTGDACPELTGDLALLRRRRPLLLHSRHLPHPPCSHTSSAPSQESGLTHCHRILAPLELPVPYLRHGCRTPLIAPARTRLPRHRLSAP